MTPFLWALYCDYHYITKSMDLSDKYVFYKQVNITSSMLFEDATLLSHPKVVKSGLMLELYYEIQRCGSLCVTANWCQNWQEASL